MSSEFMEKLYGSYN